MSLAMPASRTRIGQLEQEMKTVSKELKATRQLLAEERLQASEAARTEGTALVKAGRYEDAGACYDRAVAAASRAPLRAATWRDRASPAARR